MTQEFHISLTPVGQEEYLVRTERVAQGAPLAEEQLVLPIQDWLAQAQHLMSDPLLRLLQASNGATNGARAESAKVSQNLVEFGQHLYAALFQRTLRDSWLATQGIALHRGEALRLRLGLKGTRLPRLPWEVMHSLELAPMLTHHTQPPRPKSRPLATGTEIVLSRYQAGVEFLSANLPSALEPGQPLRLLMAIAAPTDQVRLNLNQEANQLKQELTAKINSPNDSAFPRHIELTILEQPGREQLTQALEQGNYHVFHYAGHSNLGDAGGSLYLVNERTGLTEPLSGDDLAGLLVNNGILMAVFNSCQGAYTAASDPLNGSGRSLTEALVNRGIPAVLAMAENIPDDVALTLSRLFYRNLRQGYPIDLSLSRARQGLISAYGSQQLYWALPVLYMHPGFDGYFVVGDRTTHNPADQLLLSLPSFDNPPTIPNDEFELNPTVASPSSSSDERDFAMIADAVLADDEGQDWFDDVENEALTADDELFYEEGAPAVAELIQQLSNTPVEAEEFVQADEYEILLPDETNPVADLYKNLPQPPNRPTEQDRVQPVPSVDSSPSGALAVIKRGNLAQAPQPISITVEDDVELPPSEPEPRSNQPRRDRSIQTKQIRYGLMGLGAAAAIALTIALVPKLWTSSSDPSNHSPSPTTTIAPKDLKTADTAAVTQAAIAQLSRGNWSDGQPTVEELLDRGALEQARTVFESIPPKQLDHPTANFLRGRLAWEFIQRGNPDFSVEDVQRYWGKAVEAEPNQIPYRTALGFAYYANSEFKPAIEHWCKAIELAQAQSPAAGTELMDAVEGVSCPLSSQPMADFDVLNSYAGIALVSSRLAFDNSSADSSRYLDQAIALQKAVLTTAPSYLDDQTLARDWLWSETAIGEWKDLSGIQQ